MLVRDLESRESLETKEVRRSLFWVLRRGEAKEGDQEELERREDDVEDSAEGWREGQEEG